MNWIICPVRNGLHLTRAAMEDFLDQNIGDIAVLLLDNDSTDGTAQWAATLGPAVHTSRVADRGVAASWNFGLRWVFGRGEQYALVVNNDVRLRPDTYHHLVDDGGEFVTAVGTTDMEKIEPKAELKNTLIALQCMYDQPNPTAKRPHPDLSCYLIRREVWDNVGPFNESYTSPYVEDADYHLRRHHADVKADCLDLPFYHLGAGTIKCASDDEVVAIQSAADANRRRFHEAHGVQVGSKEYYALFGHGPPAQDGGAL